MTFMGPAPVAMSAVTGSGCTFSMPSEKSLMSTPEVWMPSARMPGMGPSPTAATKIRAQTSSLMERERLAKNRMAVYRAFRSACETIRLPGIRISSVLRDAAKASGKAISTERMRAKTAICTVSSMETRYLLRLELFRLGGKKPLSAISGFPPI